MEDLSVEAPNISLNTDGSAAFAGPISPGDADSVVIVNVDGEVGGCLLSTAKGLINSSRTANIGSAERAWNNGYYAGTISSSASAASGAPCFIMTNADGSENSGGLYQKDGGISVLTLRNGF